MSENKPTPERLVEIDYGPPPKDWMDPRVEFRKGTFNYPAQNASEEYLGLPNSRKWDPRKEDWNLPENYCNIVRDHHLEQFDSKDMLQNLVRLANKACLKLGIGMVKDPDLVLVATPEAEALHVSEVDLAQLEIMLEDSQVMASG